MSQPAPHTRESVEKLLAERRKLAVWISSLDGRRADTSPAVYQRVHADYMGKLDNVQGKLVAASDALQKASADVAGRLVGKEQVLAAKQAERAEAELRSAVGEFSGREWEKRRTKLDDDMAVASSECAALREELARLRHVLGEVAGASAGVEQAGTPKPWAAEPESTEPESTAIQTQEQLIIASLESAMPLEPSFDELAFLKMVVERPTPLGAPRHSAKAPPVAPPPVAPPRSSKASYPVPEPPLEDPDTMPEPRVSQEMTPPRESFFGRSTPRSSEAFKSLICQECGTPNLPTEWYCERCGGELSAL